MADSDPDLGQAVTVAATPSGTLTDAVPARSVGPPDTSLVGKLFAHFRIDRPLGKGGMGEVYLATDMALDRQVALKLLPRAVAEDTVARERFYREARAQARLAHPNICHIYYIGEQDGQLFFAMEYVEGETLQERLERAGKLPASEALELVRQAAEGLREAHRHGFTHRDIKPSNLIVSRHGVLKLVDFGLVKSSVPAGAPAGVGAALTQTGAGDVLLGTPLYMSPEQARGDKVDHRADIYSLGVTLHHLIAGQPPFSGPSALAVVSKHLTDPRPRFATRARGGAQMVEELCDKMMAKRPDERFADYDELLSSLERVSPRTSRAAGFWVRFFAVTIDCFLLLVLDIPLMLLGELVARHTDLPKLELLPVLGMGYSIVCHARSGQTLAKRALEIQVVRSDGAGRLGWGRAAARFVIEWGLPCYVVFGMQMLDLDTWPRTAEIVAKLVLLSALFVPLLFGIVAHATGRRPLWDAAVGTRVIYRQSRVD